MKDIKDVQSQVSTLPRAYYSSTQPTGTDYKDGDIWYKTSTDTTNNTVVYTAYKWNRNTNTWDPLLDATSSHNYIGSAPANPINGDFWMDNTTLKQYQNGVWKTIPTQGPQGIPGANGVNGKTYYTWIKYATDSSGSNISDSPTGMSYIGIAYNKGSQTESSTPTDYKWTKIKGDDGIPGAKGADGKTSYFHVAYANSADGKDGFTTSPNISSSYRYLGTYTDYTSTSSRNPSSYTWAPMFDSTKKRNFTSQPTTPYAVGDTWTESGATYFCTTARDSGAFRHDDWTMQQLTIHSLAPSVANSLYNDNLVSGTDQEYTMGYGIPNTVWQDGYAYLKLPTNVTSNEILPQDPHTFWYTLTAGQEYTQTVWFETDATVKDLSVAQITWFTYVGHDFQPTTLINLGENKYKLYSTYMWPGKSNNNVRLFDIVNLNFAFDLSTGTYLKFGKLKLEKGSVATPWCLSQSELTTTTRDYRGVTLNDRGLTATAGSTTVAMNSNDGFLINNASGQVFHVDTNGNLNMKGNITAGNISGVNFTGNNLTLNNSLQVVNGNISADSGNVVINSNGLTIKDGGLKIVNGNNETTTEIRDDGTFATNKGYFSGEVHTTKLILSGKDSDINMGGLFHVDSDGNVTAKSITITGGTVDAGNTKFENFSADIITSGTLDANKLNVKNLSADSITTGILRSITINNGNNTFRVDPNGNVVANSIHVNNGSIYQGQILGADLYSISNLTSNSLNSVNDATQNWVKLKDGTIELHGANGNHYSSIMPVDVSTSWNIAGSSDQQQHGLGILDSQEIIIGQAALYSDDNNRITHSTNLSMINRTNLTISGSGIQATLAPDWGDSKGAYFTVQKDNKVGFYVGDGDNGNELRVTTAGNNNRIAFNTNNFDIDGEVNITNNHGLTAKNVHVTGWLGVDGSKNSIVRTSQGTVAINAYETAEYYFGDIGEGQTDSNGVAYVGIEKLFNETVNTSIPYQVFITAYGPGNVWVEQRKQDRFMVKSSQPNIKFGWEIKAKRKGYEHTRLQNVDNMIKKPAGIR